MQYLKHVHKPEFSTILRTLLACTALVATEGAHACAACGSTLSRDWETQGLSGSQGFVAELSYDYLNQNRQFYGSGKASPALINRQLNAGQEVEAYTRTQTTTAALMYNDDAWGVGVQLPYLHRTHGTYGNTPPLGTGYSSSADSSIGDVRLTGRYSGFSEERNSGLIAGVKLPTGATHANFSAGASAGMPLDSSLQIGTGSTDVIFGGYTTGAVDHYGWFVQGTVQHAVSIQNNYRPGDTLSLNTGIRYAGFGARVSPMLQLNIINRQADNGANATPPDPVTGGPTTGGTLAYLAPGVSVRAGGGLSIYGFVQLPVYRHVNSLQLVPAYTLTLGARLAF
jgi:hypothetical protein